MKKIFPLPLWILAPFFLLVACGAPATPVEPSTETPSPIPIPTEYYVPENLPPGAPTRTIPPPPTEIPTETITPTITLTPIPTLTPSLTPTPKIYVPVAPGTPVIDMGFQGITLETVPQLTPAWQAVRPEIRQAVPSGDGQKLFISTSNGLFVFDKSGAQLAHWRDIFTFGLPCQSCLSVNQDGSRFAVLARNAGRWEVQVYDVQDVKWTTRRLSIPLETTFRGRENEGLVLLSPDSSFLAYAMRGATLRIFNLQSGRQVFSSEKPLNDIQFSADSGLFIARESRNLLLYNTKTWEKPATLLLPAIDTPFAVAPDAQSLAIAFANRLRIYAIDGLKVAREFTQPGNQARQWQLSFLDESTLQGVSITWNGARTRATVVTAAWDIQSGQTMSFNMKETDSLSPFPPGWELDFPLEDSTNDVRVGEYNAFRFISNEMLVINTTHAVCWLKFIVAEQNCVEDTESVVFSSDTIAFKETVSSNRTLLQSWRGETVLDVFGEYRVRSVDRSGEWILIDVRGAATDLYGRGRKRAEESVGGAFQAQAETRTLIAYSTQQRSQTFVITVTEKSSGKTLAQKKDVFLLNPLLLNQKGALLLLKRDIDKGLTIVSRMEPPRYDIREVTRLTLPAEVQVMAYSTREDLLAFALADGSVVVYSPDFELSAVFQAFDSPVTALAFSPDDRFLAAASRDGIKVFVVRP